MEAKGKEWDGGKARDPLENLPAKPSKPIITIVTFLWGRWYDRIGEYLEELEKGFQKHTTFPLRFVCLAADTTIPPFDRSWKWEFLPLKSPSKLGNLRKLGLYNPENNFQGRLLACDLDIMIVGSLDDILGYEGELLIKGKHQYAKENKRYAPDGDLFLHNIRPDRWEKAWRWIRNHIQKIEARTKGQERSFYRRFGHQLWPALKIIQEEFPGQVRSFKKDKIRKTRKIPPDTRIISFHGKKVKPHMVDWLKGYGI